MHFTRLACAATFFTVLFVLLSPARACAQTVATPPAEAHAAPSARLRHAARGGARSLVRLRDGPRRCGVPRRGGRYRPVEPRCWRRSFRRWLHAWRTGGPLRPWSAAHRARLARAAGGRPGRLRARRRLHRRRCRIGTAVRRLGPQPFRRGRDFWGPRGCCGRRRRRDDDRRDGACAHDDHGRARRHAAERVSWSPRGDATARRRPGGGSVRVLLTFGSSSFWFWFRLACARSRDRARTSSKHTVLFVRAVRCAQPLPRYDLSRRKSLGR